MELRDYSTALRRHPWCAASAAILVLVPGTAYALMGPPVYTARTTVALEVSARQTPRDLADGVTLARQQLPDVARLVELPVVLGPAAAALDVPVGTEELGRLVSVEARTDSSVLEVAARAEDPATAVDRADAVAGRLVQVAEEIAPSGARADLGLRATVISPAQPPRAASGPRRRLTVLVTVVGGLVAAVVVAAVVDAPARRRRRPEPEDLPPLLAGGARLTRRDPAAGGPRGTRGAPRRALVGAASGAAVADLAPAVLASAAGGGLAVCVLDGRRGPSRVLDDPVLADLVAAARARGARVLVVDGARPGAGAGAPAGLEQVLAGERRLADVVVRADEVDVLLPGGAGGAGERLDPVAVRGLLDVAGRSYDAVLLRAPDPGTSRGLALAGAAAEVLLVGRGPGARAALASAAATLAPAGPRLRGVVVS